MFGINLHVLLPLRVEASEVSEMATQLLFGELFVVKEMAERWLYIENVADGYRGWVDRGMCTLISEAEFDALIISPKQVVGVPVAKCQKWNSETFYLTMGSTFYPQNQRFIQQYQVDDSLLSELIPKTDAAPILQTAFLLLGAPYLWGGKSVMGIDCSGLTQLIFFMNGRQLARDAKGQALQGIAVATLSEARPCDLAFFSALDGRITHVGMILPENRIIHASGSVRIDEINEAGIINVDTQIQTHKLHSIRRII